MTTPVEAMDVRWSDRGFYVAGLKGTRLTDYYPTREEAFDWIAEKIKAELMDMEGLE